MGKTRYGALGHGCSSRILSPFSVAFSEVGSGRPRRATTPDPLVHFRQLELPKPPDAVGGHSLGLYPAVDRIPYDSEMGCEFLD